MDNIKQCRNSYVHKYIKSTMFSVLTGLIATIIGLIIFSIIVCKLNVPSILISIFVIFIASLGGFVCGYMNGRIIKQKGIIVGSLSGLAFIVILLLFRISFFVSIPTWFTIIQLLLILMFSAFGGIVSVNKKTKRIKY